MSQTLETFTGSTNIEINVNAIIEEIARTKRAISKSDIKFWNFRRFLMTLGVKNDWSDHQIQDAYFKEDTRDFYWMVIGRKPVTMKALRLRSKSFLRTVNEYAKRYDTYKT